MVLSSRTDPNAALRNGFDLIVGSTAGGCNLGDEIAVAFIDAHAQQLALAGRKRGVVRIDIGVFAALYEVLGDAHLVVETAEIGLSEDDADRTGFSLRIRHDR